MRRPLLTLLAFAITAATVACLGKSSATGSTQSAVSYAILFGHVNAPPASTSVTVSGQAYVDSSHAVSKLDVVGTFGPAMVDGGNNYFEPLALTRPTVLYMNVEGVAINGTHELTDTVHAIRVRLDSIGGGPHDSLQVNLTLH